MDPVTGISLGRLVVGSVAIARPDLLAKGVGSTTGGSAVVARMFGARELALAVVTLVSRGKPRRRLVLAGIGVDAGDAAAGYLALQDGTADRRAASALTGVAAGAVLAGLASLAADARARRTENKLRKAHQKLAG